MAKVIGMNRAIKLEWLNKTAELVRRGHDDKTIRAELQEYLSFEIDSAVNLKNARTILLQTWVYTPAEHHGIRKEALALVEKGGVDALAGHWSMLLVTYPVFADVCSLIGKLSNIQDTFSSTWLKEKLFEIWGERGTLVHSVSRTLQTLRYLGVVETVKTGVFKIKKQDLTSQKAIEVLLTAMLLLKEKAYYEIAELSFVSKLFPFVFDVSYEWLHNSEVFKLNNFGGKVVLTAE
jgi:hypothetical protein